MVLIMHPEKLWKFANGTFKHHEGIFIIKAFIINTYFISWTL